MAHQHDDNKCIYLRKHNRRCYDKKSHKKALQTILSTQYIPVIVNEIASYLLPRAETLVCTSQIKHLRYEFIQGRPKIKMVMSVEFFGYKQPILFIVQDRETDKHSAPCSAIDKRIVELLTD